MPEKNKNFFLFLSQIYYTTTLVYKRTALPLGYRRNFTYILPTWNYTNYIKIEI